MQLVGERESASITDDHPLHGCLTYVIWQYDFRNQPPRPDMLRRQVEEVLASGADAVLRGWFKWGSDLDYQAMRSVVNALHAHGVRFIGGLTCSACVRGENGLPEETFLDFTTCDALGQRHEIFPGGQAYHVSIHNPRVSEYMVQCALKQVAAGVDGLHLDEIWGIGTSVSPHPNEGYDDYALAAFREYLKCKYPQLTRTEWQSHFDIDEIDVFDYRLFLTNHATRGEAWAIDPDRYVDENPLAREWKHPGMRAVDICETWFSPDPMRSFYDYGVLQYGRRLAEGIRAGARQMGRPIALVHNGPWPGMELQNWNLPTRPPGMDTAELRCHRERWQRYRAMTDQWSYPGAPAVAFIDWPGDLPAYTAWTTEKKITFLQTAPMECYAMGCSFAFHLRNFIPGSDARENGTYETMIRLCRWVGDHRDLYHPRGAAFDVAVSDPDICAVAYHQADRVIIHLINHWVAAERPATQHDVVLASSVTSGDYAFALLSPEGDLPAPRLTRQGLLIPALPAYAILVGIQE
jgi:hypothetical protein